MKINEAELGFIYMNYVYCLGPLDVVFPLFQNVHNHV